ncbi:MAG: ankyrin repeat domain-containing protein [Verrucomicrobiae bacterium]|nr:ankyrin repeat domain-containing protein [Verrucomicrobiae bacterium]
MLRFAASLSRGWLGLVGALALIGALSLKVAAEDASSASSPAPAPLPTFQFQGRAYNHVTLSSVSASRVTISHDFGITDIPLQQLSVDQARSLNGTTKRVQIDVSKIDPDPPSAEAVQIGRQWITAARGVDGRLADGNTPLFEAIQSNRADLVKFLLSQGANPNATNAQGQTALLTAAGQPKVTAMLQKAGAQLPDIFGALNTGDLGSFEYLLGRQPDLWKAANAAGRNVFMEAIHQKKAPFVEAALKSGAPLDTPDAEGNTPLMIACRDNCTPVGKVLLDHGANPNTRNLEGKTPLILASNQSDLLEFLLAKGANMKIKDHTGENALMAAARDGNTDSVKVLLAHGADPTVVNRDGQTAGGLAATPALAEILNDAAAKAPTDTAKKKGRILELARQRNSEIVEQAAGSDMPDFIRYIAWTAVILSLSGRLLLGYGAYGDSPSWAWLVWLLPGADLIYWLKNWRETTTLYLLSNAPVGLLIFYVAHYGVGWRELFIG